MQDHCIIFTNNTLSFFAFPKSVMALIYYQIEKGKRNKIPIGNELYAYEGVFIPSFK